MQCCLEGQQVSGIVGRALPGWILHLSWLPLPLLGADLHSWEKVSCQSSCTGCFTSLTNKRPILVEATDATAPGRGISPPRWARKLHGHFTVSCSPLWASFVTTEWWEGKLCSAQLILEICWSMENHFYSKIWELGREEALSQRNK